MKLLYKVLFLLVITLISNVYSNAQSLQIVTVDPSKYPSIMMEFYAKDNNGNDVRNFNSNDIKITDSACTNIQPNLIYCPPTGQSKFSLIITLDYSGSMFTDLLPNGLPKYTAVVEAALAAIAALPTDRTRWECAVNAFASCVKLVQDFTNDSMLLVNAIRDVYKQQGGQTDYNAGFLYCCHEGTPGYGALRIAKHSKYKPVIIFLTDGDQNYQTGCSGEPSRQSVWQGQISQEAKNVNPSHDDATIFSIIVGLDPSQQQSASQQALQSISLGTYLGDYITSTPDASKMSDIFLNLLAKAGTLGRPAPCQVTWDACCSGGQHVNMAIQSLGVAKDTTYSIDNAVKPSLEVSDRNPIFRNTTPTVTVKQAITIIARKNFVIVYGPKGFKSGDNKFAIDWHGITLPYTIKKNDTLKIDVTYTGAADSIDYTTDLNLLTSACDGNLINPSAGWIYANSVNVGATSIGVSINTDVTAVFCNEQHTPVNITGITFEGGQNTEFSIVSPVFPFVLPADSCQSFTFSFKPADNGTRVSTMRVKTSLGEYTAPIQGSASGYAEISSSPKDISFPHTNCTTPFVDTVITITNPGALDLNVSQIKLSNNTDFKLTSPATPLIIGKNNGSITVKVRFQPQPPYPPYTKTTVLEILSDANNSPDLKLNIQGTWDSVGFAVSNLNVDFGELCPNEAKDKIVTLTNTGTIGVNITGKDAVEFTLPVKSINIPTSLGTQDLTIHFSAAASNNYNEIITLTDECGNSYNINCKALVGAPAITVTTVNPLNLTSTIGGTISGTITIKNSSNRIDTITNVTPRDAQITYNPPPPWYLAQGTTKDITVTYKPSPNAKLLNTYIDLEGAPCSFKDSLNVIGNPNLAIATLAFDNQSGYIGLPVKIPVHIRNMVNFPPPGVTSITTTVTYDQTLLSYVSVIPNSTTVTTGNGNLVITNSLISSITGDVLDTLVFNVLSTSSATFSDLIISNSVTVGGVAQFIETKGIFSIIPVSASLEVGTVSAYPGDVFDLPIYLKDIKNITNSNQFILTTIKYNGYLAEPISPTPTGTIDPVTHIRTIPLTTLPVTPDGTGLLKNLKFRAMLGTDTTTVFEVSGTQLAKGFANFSVTNGKLILKGICNSGGPRLFDPTINGAAILQVIPNPAEGNVSVTLQVQEPGRHSLALFSTVGTQVLEIFNRELKTGEITVDADLKLISSGVYYLSYVTPTVRITKLINILK